MSQFSLILLRKLQMNRAARRELQYLNTEIRTNRSKYKRYTSLRLFLNLLDIVVCATTATITIKSINTEYYLPDPGLNDTYNYYNLNMCVIVGNYIETAFALWATMLNIYALYTGKFYINSASKHHNLQARHTTLPHWEAEESNTVVVLGKFFMYLIMLLFTFSVNIALYICNRKYDFFHAWAKISAIAALATAVVIMITAILGYFFCTNIDEFIDELIRRYDNYPTQLRGNYPSWNNYNLYTDLLSSDLADNDNRRLLPNKNNERSGLVDNDDAMQLAQRCHWCANTRRRQCVNCYGTGKIPCGCKYVTEMVAVERTIRKQIDTDSFGKPIHTDCKETVMEERKVFKACGQCVANKVTCKRCNNGYTDCDKC